MIRHPMFRINPCRPFSHAISHRVKIAYTEKGQAECFLCFLLRYNTLFIGEDTNLRFLFNFRLAPQKKKKPTSWPASEHLTSPAVFCRTLQTALFVSMRCLNSTGFLITCTSPLPKKAGTGGASISITHTHDKRSDVLTLGWLWQKDSGQET